MKNGQKTAGETANPITFMAEWIDFTQHLTNAQFGRLAKSNIKRQMTLSEGFVFIRLMTRTENRRKYGRRKGR